MKTISFIVVRQLRKLQRMAMASLLNHPEALLSTQGRNCNLKRCKFSPAFEFKHEYKLASEAPAFEVSNLKTMTNRLTNRA